MGKIFIYVVDRDFGFAPNPFHGVCTLATCKPHIRRSAGVGDWVVGMGGRRLKATGKCVFAMQVSEVITFDQYWNDKRFVSKKPVRNGSKKVLVGDNIYHRGSQSWLQADSHHSNADGSINLINLEKDTSANAVLISDNFYYFGASAAAVPSEIIERLGYENGIGHRTFASEDGVEFLAWLKSAAPRNRLMADPHDFTTAEDRYSGSGSKIISG
jgi:hypothetical protein